MLNITAQKLHDITANMPMKQINIDGEPYLQRYYAGTFECGSDLWLHRFLSNDGERHLHNHPFEFSTIMLTGGYVESYIDSNGRLSTRETLPNKFCEINIDLFAEKIKASKLRKESMLYSAGVFRAFSVFEWHRISSIQDDTWTAVIVGNKRLPKWFFRDESGQVSDMFGSPSDWWKNYKTRPDCDIALDDNHV